MADIQPPPAGAAPQTRVGQIAKVSLGTGAAFALAAALATAGIKPDEAKVNTTYVDLAKVPTYCWGHADRASRVGTPHTDAQCETILAADVATEMNAVATCVPALRDRPYQWAASTRLAHNIGPSGFCHSGAAIAFRRGNWRTGCDLFLSWDKAHVGGQFVRVSGLAARRQRERAQCLTGLK